jgi:hypothetical protein
LIIQAPAGLDMKTGKSYNARKVILIISTLLYMENLYVRHRRRLKKDYCIWVGAW